MRSTLFGFVCAVIMLLPAMVYPRDQPSAWTNLGLYGGQVQALAVAPANSGTVFSGFYLGEGLYRSTDGTNSWVALKMDHQNEGEDTFENQSVRAIAVAPSDPNIVWAAHNQWVAKSVDGGNSWTHIRNDTMQKYCTNCSGSISDQYRICQAIAIDPDDADVVYVGTAGPQGTDTKGAVYRTTDGGTHWEKLNQGVDLDYGVTAIDLHPQKPGVILAGTDSNGTGGVWDGTVYLSTDNGGQFSSPDPRPISGSGVIGLTWHPTDSDVFFMTGGLGVVRVVLDGDQWLPAFAVTGSALATRVVFSPANPDVLYTGWNLPASWGGDGLPKISVSTDGGENWQTIALDPGIMTSPLALAVDPLAPDTLYWGDASGGVLKSTDGGQSWTPVNRGLTGVVVQDVDSDVQDGSHLIAATTSGVYERVDGQWQKRLNRSAATVRFAPDDSSTYYAGLYAVLARTQDGGNTWQSSSENTNGYITHIEIDPLETDTIFVTDNSHVRRSTDGGDTFTAVLEGINSAGEAHHMNVVVIDPTNSQRLLAGGGNFNLPRITGGLWESLDGGDTWTPTGLSDVIVNDVLVHPDDPDIIFAGCGFSDNTAPPLFKSLDGGKTWTEATNGLPTANIKLYEVWGSIEGTLFTVGAYGCALRVSQGAVETLDSGVTEDLLDVYGLDANTVFAVGDQGTILHFDGTSWTRMENADDQDLAGIWGSSADRLFAVGSQGKILSYAGEAWTPMVSPVETNLSAIYGIAGDDVVAVGAEGTILHFDGSRWQAMASPTTSDLYALWGTTGGKWFAAGEDGAILFYDGSSWSAMESPAAANITGIWVDTATDVYAVTTTPGTLLHFDGQEWKATAGPDDRLNDVWGIEGRGLYAVQGNGGIFHYTDQQWETLRAPGDRFRSITDLEFHRQNLDIVYAATLRAGIYLSPVQGDGWLDLGMPPLEVPAITIGSLYAATGGGLYQLTGTGVLAGNVSSDSDGAILDGARVSTDFGQHYTTLNGQYMLVAPSGVFNVYATADQYGMTTAPDVTVIGGEVTWQDFTLQMGSSYNEGESGSVTTGDSGSGGGAYCFISCMNPGDSTATPGWALLLISGFVLSNLWRPRSHGSHWNLCRWLPWFLLFGAFGVGVSAPQAEAFSIFQQVGVTSPPQPVGSGARAMGMGGTFIAIADDATAASWNPAGLIQLERPEISIVGDAYATSNAYTSDQHPEIENTARNDQARLNYLSASMTFHWKKNLAVSINYQRLYDFFQDLDYRRNLNTEAFQLVQQIQYEQTGMVGAVGIAGAVELTPRLSLGLTINVWTDQLGFDNGWEASYDETATGSQDGVPVSINTSIRDEYDGFRGINANLGALYEMGRWGTLGAVVKTPFSATIQHHYRFDQTQTFGDPLNTSTTIGPIRVDEEVELNLPWSYGLGWSKRFGDQLTLGVDIYRTEWSDYYLEDSQGIESSPIDGRPRSVSDVDATTHFRMGGEYLLLWPYQSIAVPIRMGLFYDPEPSEGSPEDVYGIALGTGITTRRVSLDLAYQLRWSEDKDSGNIIATSSADMVQHTILASCIYYF